MNRKQRHEDTGRINVDIPADLHKAARHYCVEHDMTLSALVAKAFRLVLETTHATDASR